MLFDDLKNEFYINDHEQQQHAQFMMVDLINKFQKDILKSANNAIKTGEDVDKAVAETIKEILNSTTGKVAQRKNKI